MIFTYYNEGCTIFINDGSNLANTFLFSIFNTGDQEVADVFHRSCAFPQASDMSVKDVVVVFRLVRVRVL